MTDQKRIDEVIDKLTNELAQKGQLIEGGWVALELSTLKGAPPIQLEMMRDAYFLGAQHLFASLMEILDPSEEPTDADLNRVTLIDNELKAFVEKFRLKHQPPAGHS